MSIFNILLCALLAPIAAMMLFTKGSAYRSQLLQKDANGYALAIVSLILVIIGLANGAKDWGTAAVAIAGVLLGLGVLIALPEGPTSWLIDKKNIGYMALAYGVINVFQNVFAPIANPWNTFVDRFVEAYEIFSEAVGVAWQRSLDMVNWSEMTPALIGVALIVFGILWVVIYPKIFKK